MSEFLTTLYPGLFEIGGAITRPSGLADLFNQSNMNNGIYQVQEGMAELYRAQRTNLSGPWYAVVLHVEEFVDPGDEGTYGPVNFYNIAGSKDKSAPREYIRVWARRYPEDQGIPQPDYSFIDPSYKNPQRWLEIKSDEQRLEVIKAHDSYLIPKSMWGFKRLPVPGDLVYVTFDDILNQKRGRLMDFVDSGTNPPELASWAQNIAAGATGAFSNLAGPISNVFEEDLGPQIREPTFHQMQEARNIVALMVPGPDVSMPNALAFKQAGPPKEMVQTVIWNNGRIVYREMAYYLVALFMAARRDGVELFLASSFRTPFNDMVGSILKPFLLNEHSTAEPGLGIAGTSDEATGVGWDGKPFPAKFLKSVWTDPTKNYSSAQATLRIANCDPGEGYTHQNCPIKQCDPLTGPAGNTWYPTGHGSGLAGDVGTGTVDTKQEPNPNVGHQYRWMCMNAWKFGFVRTVRSERWHWELKVHENPRPHMFKGSPGSAAKAYYVPRDNGSWDGQFNNPDVAFYDDPVEAQIKQQNAQHEENKENARQASAENYGIGSQMTQ